MSDPYGVANPTDQEIKWEGEMPLPTAIYANDPGVSNLKAAADHSHALSIGTVDAPWNFLGLGASVVNFGGGWRPAQYCRLGNLTFVRGVVNCSAYAGALPLVLGLLPQGFCPVTYGEIGIGYGFGGTGAFRVDYLIDGKIQLSAGGIANPAYLSLGAPIAILCVD